MKLIEFYPCGYRGTDGRKTFKDTESAISRGDELIRTESMLHFGFGLIGKGYNVVLVGAHGQRTRMYPGMTAPNGKPINEGHNIAKLCLNGVLDPWMK